MVQPPPQKGPDAHDVIRLVAFSALGVAVVTIFVMALFPKPEPPSAGPTLPSSTESRTSPKRSTPTEADIRRQAIEDAGLDPSVNYPYWPLVYTLPKNVQRSRSSEYLVGEVRNYGPKRYRYVQISFSLLHNGVKVADAFDNTAGLAPYETWRYEAFVFYDGPYDTMRVENVSAY